MIAASLALFNWRGNGGFVAMLQWIFLLHDKVKLFLIFFPSCPRVYDTMKKFHVDMSIPNLPARVAVSAS